MKIAFFELEGWEHDLIKEQYSDHEVFLYSEKLSEEAIPEVRDFDIISVFIDSRVDRAVIDALQNVKLIATRSTGFDHIDKAVCKDRGIRVAYVPGYGDNTVAEFAFGLVLNLTRKIYHSIDQIKESENFSLKGLRGMDVKGKNMGIIGTGRIGREMGRIANGFGMKLLAYDPYPNEQFINDFDVTYMALEDLLQRSDVISIHCPYMPETHHLINRDTIRHIKNGAYLVNTARGSIVETGAIIKALEDGTLAGFGTDVLEEEGETKDEMRYLSGENTDADEMRVMLQNHVLMHMPTALITPHNAFNSHEALERILRTTFGNIDGFINGGDVCCIPE
jgi:D-lactate dehydrogenase